MVNFLETKWRKSGIEKDDIVLLHSSIKRTILEAKSAGYHIDPKDILNSFLNVIGAKGTLLLPLFNFDFTQGIGFDIRTSPSKTGALTEAGRLHPESVRTGHPMYSFAIIGHKSKEFENIDNESGYAKNSPFGILKTMNGKIASLDLDDQNSMTFYHHVEEMKQVDYRYFKEFKGQYTDVNGLTSEKIYKLYVRDIDKGVTTNVNPAGELMWKHGLYKGYRPKEKSGLRVIKSKDMFDFVEALIDSSNAEGTLYSIEKK